MKTNSLSLVRKLCVCSFAILLVPLLQQSAAAHSFSTSFLTLSAHEDNAQLRWSWRFTAHDIEALTGSSDATAALPLLGEWLRFNDDCRPEPSTAIDAGVHAGEQTYTYSGTAPCAYSTDIDYTVRHIFGPLPDHKVLQRKSSP
ncbi:hypothetical protein [Pseudidiomarina homiensis]|uniref:hypothetical protein n=1 Tax=Pseudidiomarina homiensis TaxID=364198 RepID=UPI00215B15CE|nr:hypothetical protein [Pseudidiomarina homiensis]